MDPPIAPEFVAAHTGIPLQQPRRAINLNVREMVDQIHHQGIFRTGDEEDMPYTAYGPAPQDGSATFLPPALAVAPHRPNRHIMRE